MAKRWSKPTCGPITEILRDAPTEVYRAYVNRPTVTAILLSSMMTWLTTHPEHIHATGTAYCRYVLDETSPTFKREKLYADGLVYKLFEHVRHHAITQFTQWVVTTHSNDRHHLDQQLGSISQGGTTHPLQDDLFT